MERDHSTDSRPLLFDALLAVAGNAARQGLGTGVSGTFTVLVYFGEDRCCLS